MASEIVGRTGRVSLRIASATEPGEIDITVAGMRQRYVAHAQHAMTVGTEVVVTAVLGPQTVSVVKREAP